MSISKELEKKIHNTIDSLVEQGKKPTYEAIRGEGGYSFNSIKPALKSWNEQRQSAGEQQEQQGAGIEVDEELKSLVLEEFELTLTDLLMTVTKQAQQKADETLKLERIAHDETVKNFQSEIADLESYIEQSDTENEHLKVTNTELDKIKGDLVTDVDYLKDENKSLRRDIENLETENRELKQNNKQLVTDFTKTKAENSILKDQATKDKASLEKLQQQFTDLQAKSNAQLSEIAELKGTVKSYEKSDTEQRAELSELKAKHDDFVSEIATLKEQNKQLSGGDNFTLEQQTPEELAKLAEQEKKSTTRKRTTTKSATKTTAKK